VPSLKGIHYAIQSGIYAARAIFGALKADEPTGVRLAEYDRMVNGSYIVSDMQKTRNMRLAFKDGFYVGGVKAGLMTLTGGKLFGGKIDMHSDADAERTGGSAVSPETPALRPGSEKLVVSKVDAVFKSGNSTRDTIPQH